MRIEGPVRRRYDEDMGPNAASAPAPYRFTREEYHRMGEAGLFEGKRVELLDGEIITMSPQGSAHASAVNRARRALSRILEPAFLVRGQVPVILDDESEPEPDVAVCVPEDREYAGGHPEPKDILLVLEIAASSLVYDRGRKAAAYSRVGIPVYGIVNLERRVLELMTDPDPAAVRYRKVETLAEDAHLSLPGGARVAVADLLPPR
jgi:Uma2 family endonuclease